jgi:NhaA family Na+:H+ antiporter
MFIPIKIRSKPRFSPLKTLEHDLHPVVAFVILPIFALANAGIDFSGISIADLFHRVTLGVGLGLFIGKLLGVVLFCWLCVALKFTRLPRRVNWPILVGTAALCGIGFTMSLFIGSLAYGEFSVEYLHYERLGILSGSLCSGLLGFYLLHRFLPPPRANMVK